MKKEKFKIDLQLFAEGDDDDKNIPTPAEVKDVPVVDVEELKKTLRADIIAENEAIKKKEDEDKELKDNIEMIKQVQEKMNKQDEISEETDATIALSRLQGENKELQESLKLVLAKLESSETEKTQAKVKNEILTRVEKEDYLKDTVKEYLDNGTIKSIEDYDRVITSTLKATLKETAELKEKIKKLGGDPAGDYSNDNRNIVNDDAVKQAAKDRMMKRIKGRR